MDSPKSIGKKDKGRGSIEVEKLDVGTKKLGKGKAGLSVTS